MTQLRATACVIASIALVLTVSGCAAPPPTPVVATDEVQVALEKAMSKVDAMPPHARSADAKAPEAVMASGLITIRSYQNEAAKLLTRIAAARGMKFAVRGPEPHLPLFVSIDVENVAFEEFLATVGHQFGQRADLVLTNDAIEIRYRGM